MVENVYTSAKDKLTSLNDKEFASVISTLLKNVPKGLEGAISAGERTASILKKSSLGGCVIKNELKEEGFIFVGKEMEIDFRISQVLKQNQEETDPEIIRILFNS